MYEKEFPSSLNKQIPRRAMSKGHVGLSRALQAEEMLSPSLGAAPPPKPATTSSPPSNTCAHAQHSWCSLPGQTYALREGGWCRNSLGSGPAEQAESQLEPGSGSTEALLSAVPLSLRDEPWSQQERWGRPLLAPYLQSSYCARA